MKLLFDANLSPDLALLLSDLFPGSTHVQDFQNLAAEDKEIWEYALLHGYAIVTKDSDFDAMSRSAQISPKIIWIRRGNCRTALIAQIIRSNFESIQLLDDEQNDLSVLVLY